MWSEFKAFLLKTNALALAIGVIIGAALGAVVSSLVNDIIMPPVGLVLGGIDFASQKWVLQKEVGTDPTAQGYVAEVAIRYGAFINAVIAFVVIAFVVWRLSKMFIKEEPAAAVPPSKTCPYCKEANAVDATKCLACASSI